MFKCCAFQSLGEVAEVSYVHSNQNVVGSSKAENQMSWWAVRDVFELQQFSQLPANVAVYSPKVRRKILEGNVCLFFNSLSILLCFPLLTSVSSTWNKCFKEMTK